MQMQFSVDLLLIWRCLGALLWGIGLACFLQFHRMGAFLAKERTWLTVIVGVGVDLLLAIGAAWWEVWLIVAFSSLGIVWRSLHNEESDTPNVKAYKTLWAMEAALDAVGDVITELQKALETSDGLAHVSKVASRSLTLARYGEAGKK
jgi:hypothetical protein